MKRTLLLLSFVVLCGFRPPEARGQVDPREDEGFSNSAFVRTSDEVKAELFFADRKVAEREWAAAVQAYQAVLDRDEPAVVQFTDRVYLSAHEAARRHLERLPPEALARYRELFDARAQAARTLARRRYDPDALVRVARRYPLSSVAPAALRDASALAAERADSATLTRALRLMRRIGELRPLDVARLALALAADADRRGIEELRARESDLLSQPVEGGGTLDDVFRRALERAPKAVDPARVEALSSGPIAARPIAQLPLDERRLVPGPDVDALGYAPIRYPLISLARVSDATWVVGRSGLFRLTERLEEVRPVVPFAALLGMEPVLRELSSRSLVPAVDGDHLVFVLTERERSYYSAGEEKSRLVCFDARKRKIAWQVAEGEATWSETLAGVAFEGPPALHGDLVLVTGSRLSTGTESSLYAFDRRSGALRWERFLASAEKVPRFVARNRKTTAERAEPSPVVVQDGVAYCSTNVGIVAAVDARSGEALWLFRYHRVKPSDAESYQRISFFDTGGWLPSAPEVVGDRLVVAPEDSHFLYVLATSPSKDGYLIGPDPLFKGTRERFVGVHRSRGELLFLEQSILGCERARVRIAATRLDGAYRESSVPLQLEEEVTGRPVVVGDALFLSTNKALYRFRLDRDRQAFDSIPVPDPLLRARERFVFGNLSFEDGRLYSVSPLAAFEIVPR